MGFVIKSLCSPIATYRCGLFFFLFYFIPFCSYSQEIKFGRINFANYPIIECPYVYTKSNGEKDFTLQVKDFLVQENNQDTRVVEVINPQSERKPVSVVLVFDISSSMKGERLALAKEAALGFLEQFPLETSEVAVASFSDQVYVNCDFTHNINRLKESINKLNYISGTNYTRAFLTSETGAIDIVQQGKYKKVIVFLTDGLSSANSAEIIRRATSDKVSVYCIAMALKMPEILKEISIQTGGYYFEAVTNIYQLHSFYSAISQLLKTSGYSLIRWKAINSCERNRIANLECRGLNYEIPYEVPAYLAGKLQTDPNVLYFGETNEQGKANASINLTAINQSFTITSVSMMKKSYFSIADSLKFPFELQPDKSHVINLQYRNSDPGLISDALVIESKDCPSIQVSLHGGLEEQLTIICPSGGEVFPVGMDTAVIWEGVKRSRNVAISYRTADNKPWKSIKTANGLYSKWEIPNDTGSNVKVKLEPAYLYDRDFNFTNRISLEGQIQYFTSNHDGSLILTIDNSGTLQLWNGNNGKLLLTLAGYRINEAMLSDDSKRIIAFTGFETFVWEISTLKLVARYTNKQKLFLSYISPGGTENLVATRIFKDITNNNIKGWSPVSNVTVSIPEQNEASSVVISPNGLMALTLNNANQLKIWDLSANESARSIKLYDDSKSVIVSPTGDHFAINSASGVKVYSRNGEAVFHVSEEKYHMFTYDGKVLITSLRGFIYNFWDVNNGNLKYTVRGPFKVAAKSSSILYYNNDTLILKNILDDKSIRIAYQSLKDAVLSPNEALILIKNAANTIDFYDIAENKFFNSLSGFESQIVQMQFSPDSKILLVATANNQVKVFKAGSNKKLIEAVSGYFSIIRPKLYVKDSIQFKPLEIGTICERFVSGFVVNNTKYPITVKKMEINGTDSSEFGLISNYFPYTIPEKSDKEVEIRFNPGSSGIKKAVLYTYTATDTLRTLIYGNATTKKVEIIVARVDFGKVRVNSTKDSLVSVIKNTSITPIVIEDIVYVGPNREQFQFSRIIKNKAISPDSSLNVSITFKPQYRGRISGSIGVKIKDMDNTPNIMLFGEGVASRELVLTGQTLNSADSLPVEAEVICTDLLSNQSIKKFNTTSNGLYTMQVNCDRNYSLTASKENFISGSENIDLTGVILTDTIKQDIYLTEIKSGALIRMNCVFFDFAKWDLLPASRAELNRLVDLLNKYPTISIEIHGHTDSIGSDQSNLVLSKNRVNSVRNYLIKSGISPNRLFLKYFGESSPIAPNSTEQGRTRNRRVEVKVR